MLRDFLYRLRALFRRNSLEAEMDAELRAHLEHQTEKHLRAGLPPEEAARRARLEFGGVEQVKEECRDRWGVRLINEVIQDVRYGLRQLHRNPGFTAVAVLTLALGIGANTAIFSIFNAVMLKTLPVQNPGQLVLFSTTTDEGLVNSTEGPHGRWNYFSTPVFEYIRDHNRVFQGIGAFQRLPDTLIVRAGDSTAGNPPERAKGRLVSGNYFSVLGVNAIEGRTLTPQDDQPSAHPTAVISYSYWKRKFNQRPSLVGQAVDVNGVPFIIVGVAPPEFYGVMMVSSPPDFWLPLSKQPEVMQSSSYLESNQTYWLNLVARLKPGVSMQQARAGATVQLHQFLTSLAGSKLSSSGREKIRRDYISLAPGGAGISSLRENFSAPLRILMVVVGLVLLIACANVANMLLSRAATRRKEISVRLALGAGRARLVRQLVTESFILAVAGGALGMLCASWATAVLLRVVRTNVPVDTSPDVTVLAFTTCISLAAVLLFGLVPALRASRVELVRALKVSGSGSNAPYAGRLDWSKGLVVVQVALSLPLLAGAGLFLRSLGKLQAEAARALNSNQKHILLVHIDPRLAGYKPSQLDGFYRQLINRMEALPDVSSASLAAYSPLSGTSASGGISIEGDTPQQGQNMDSWILMVASGYFRTEGMRLLAGRVLGKQDTAASAEVAVVNESFAQYFFPRQNPIGKHIALGSPFAPPGIEVVGVVEDARFSLNLRESPPRMIFVPVFQLAKGSSSASPFLNDLEIRAAGNPGTLAGEVRAAIRGIDKNLPILGVRTLSRQAERTLGEARSVSMLSSFLGLLALLLACAGLYGVMSYNVSRRTNEMGVRLALGANPGKILRMVLRQALVLIAVGIIIGVPLALGAARLIASELFGTEPTDPLTFVAVSLVLISVALLACYIPARRAAKVDPMVALRYE